MVGRVQVDSVPAHGEENLSSESVCAEVVLCLESVRLWSIGLSSGCETDICDGIGSGRVSVWRSSQTVTSKHAESRRDGLPVGVGFVFTSITIS